MGAQPCTVEDKGIKTEYATYHKYDACARRDVLKRSRLKSLEDGKVAMSFDVMKS